MGDHITVSYVTTPSKHLAQKLARALVEKRLAACINIIDGIESIYEWEGKVDTSNEALMVIKSTENKSEELTKFIEQNHEYDCPEVVNLRVTSGSKNYLDWIHRTVSKPPMLSE